MMTASVLKPRAERRLDSDRLMHETDRHDILRAATRNLEDRRPLVPHPDPHDTAHFWCVREPEPVAFGRKLTDRQAHEIRVHYRTGKASQRRLAKLYGVSQNVIHQIVNGRHYREATA